VLKNLFRISGMFLKQYDPGVIKIVLLPH